MPLSISHSCWREVSNAKSSDDYVMSLSLLAKLESCGKVFNFNGIIGDISSIDRKHLKLFLKDNN